MIVSALSGTASAGNAGAEAQTLHLQLPVTLAAVETARLAVAAHLAPHGLPQRTLYQIDVALEELQMNLLMHGFDDPATGQVQIDVCVASQQVRLQVSDNGRPFDATVAAPPTTPDTQQAARVGGLGLVLVRKAARSIEYERRDGCNHLRLEFARG